jgi:AcrR family transcriptional regulator
MGKVRVPRVVREQQMLDAAVAVFSRRGYHAAGMEEIAEVAGVSKPMVYAYLGTKEELFVTCLRREATRLLEAVLDAVGPGGAGPGGVGSGGAGSGGVGSGAVGLGGLSVPPEEQLRRGLRAFFGFVGAHRDGWAVLCRQARGQEPFAAEVAAMRARMVEVVAVLLARPVGAHAEEATPIAHALVGAGEAMADWVVDHPAEDPDVTATRLMNLMWPGLLTIVKDLASDSSQDPS